MATPQKIYPRDELAVVLEEHRRRKERIALCNGVFDLLHVGHIRALQDARRQADVLVVALNDDATTRNIKGQGRPFIPLAERLEIIAALQCVHYVTAFSELTVANTLRLLRPKFHAKGRDYEPTRIPKDEREVAAELNIELLLVGDSKSHSTTDIAQRLLRRTTLDL